MGNEKCSLTLYIRPRLSLRHNGESIIVVEATGLLQGVLEMHVVPDAKFTVCCSCMHERLALLKEVMKPKCN